MRQRSITTTIIAVITMNDGHYPFWFVLCSKFSRSILYISIPDGWSDPSITSTTTTMTLLCTTNSPHYFNQNKMYCFTNMDYFPLVIWFTIFLFILYRYIYNMKYKWCYLCKLKFFMYILMVEVSVQIWIGNCVRHVMISTEWTSKLRTPVLYIRFPSSLLLLLNTFPFSQLCGLSWR